LLKPTQGFIIGDMVGIWIKIFEKRRHEFRAVMTIQLRSLSKQLRDVWHGGMKTEIHGASQSGISLGLQS